MTITVPRAIHKSFDYVDAAMREACERVLNSGQYYLGPENDAFEQEVATLVNVKHAVAVNSGTSGMFLVLRALGIGQGDEVIVPAMGFVTLAEAVAVAGARPRFVDVDLETFNLDPKQLGAALTPAVKAVVPAHKYGHPANMDAILEFVERHDLLAIEDACHAFGASYKGRTVGTIGKAGFLSFAGKSISVCGLGGMILTNDDSLAQEVRLLRDHGRPRSNGKRFYEITRIGYNLRLSELHAAIGRAQLPFLKAWNERRRAIAAQYTQAFQQANLPVTCPVIRPDVVHAMLHYTLRVPADHRADLMTYLDQHAIESSVLYPTDLHLLAPYRELCGHREGDFPISEQLTGEVLSLPNHPGLTAAMVDKVIAVVTEFFT